MRRPTVRPQVEELESRTVLTAAAPPLPPAAGTVLASAPAASYTLVLKDLGQGQSARVDRQTAGVVAVTVTDATGTVLRSNQTSTASILGYRETVLQMPAGGGPPTRLRRRYDAAQVQPGGQTAGLPFQGKTVVITKQADGYHFWIRGVELTDAAAKPLADEFNRVGAQTDYGKGLLPPGPVKLRQAWAVDPAPLLQDLNRGGAAVFSAAGASGTGTLTRVYRRGGHRFGTMTFVLVLPITALPLGSSGTVPALPGSGAVVRLTLDGCVDGSLSTRTLSLDLQMNARAQVATSGGQQLTVTIAGHAVGTQVNRQLPGGA
jgi:hypothetical protein